jgi:PDZ domain-containing secreted protein
MSWFKLISLFAQYIYKYLNNTKNLYKEEKTRSNKTTQKYKTINYNIKENERNKLY